MLLPLSLWQPNFVYVVVVVVGVSLSQKVTCVVLTATTATVSFNMCGIKVISLIVKCNSFAIYTTTTATTTIKSQ